MVLDNASASEAPFAADLPPSDIDPYASPESSSASSSSPGIIKVNQPPHELYVNLNALPHQFSFVGTRAQPPVLAKGIVESCNFASGVLSRPVTQQEADAFAFHFAKTLRIGSYGAPIGVAAGTIFAVRGWNTYRFPFYTPFKEGSRFSPESFGPLKGRLARVMWQSLRLNTYWLVSAAMAQVFWGSYAISVGLAGRTMDQRLKEFNEVLRERSRTGLGKAAGGRQVDETPGARSGETYDMARQRRGVQGSLAGKRKQPGGDGSDASPTGGAFGEEYGDTAGVDGFLSEAEVRRQADEMVRVPRESGPSREDSAPRAQASRASSPASTRESSTSPKSSSGGSAWDRLRQGAISSNGEQSASKSVGSRTSASSKRDASSGDAFDFSSNDGEMQSARARAQREFDARLDQERAGKNFEDEKSGRRW